MLFKFFESSDSRPGVLDHAVKDFLSMIENCHWMYSRAGAALWGTADLESARMDIYQRDILVNKAERKVRKAIVSHLAVNPKSDIAFSLVLMSVVKDAERVGDYCKNMMDLPDYHLPRNDRNEVVDELKRIQMEVDALFPIVLHAFRDSDEAAGGDVVRREREITAPCEAVIKQVLAAEGLTNGQAVSYTLLARFHKRIAAHLGNIASSLVMPVHKLDYFDERHLPGEPEEGDDA